MSNSLALRRRTFLNFSLLGAAVSAALPVKAFAQAPANVSFIAPTADNPIRINFNENALGMSPSAQAAAHTNIGLIVNSAEFIPNNRTGWTSLMAWGSAAVFALITHEQPFAGFRFFEQRINGLWSRKIHGVLFRETFNELHMTPVVGRKIACVVVAIAGPMVGIGFQLVPLLAGNFARFAAGTD